MIEVIRGVPAAMATVTLALLACGGASPGPDAGDRPRVDVGGSNDGGDSVAADADRDLSETTDAAPDASDAPQGSDAPLEVARDDAGNDASDASPETDAGGGCGVTNGVWSLIPSWAWSTAYSTIWSTAPMNVVYSDARYPNSTLRKWNGATRTVLPQQPPPAPFIVGSQIRGSGENDIWLGGTGPWIRPGVKDRLDVDVTHWDGVSWKDLTFAIPVSPDIQNTTERKSGGGLGAFWPVGSDEAWQWVRISYDAAPGPSPYVPYHLEGGVWKAVASPLDTLDGAPATMWGAAKNDIWVGGTVNRQVPPAGDASAPTTASDPLLLHWDGSVWTRVAVPIASGNGSRGVTSIWGSAANDVWAVGRTDASADTWHFDGDRWTEVPVVGPRAFDQVWGTCAGDFWAVSSVVYTYDPQLWHYDGRAWSPVALPSGIRADRRGARVTGTGPGDVWVAVETEQTCAPYDQGPYQLVAHWGPNRRRCGRRDLRSTTNERRRAPVRLVLPAAPLWKRRDRSG